MTAPIVKPDNSSMQFQQGAGWQQKFIPKTADGTAVFDCTSWSTSPTFYVQTGFTTLDFNANATPTIVSHDATGIALSLTSAQVNTLLTTSIGSRSGNYYFTVGNGTDTVMMGVGIVAATRLQ